MNELIKEYEEKLEKVQKSIETTTNNGSQNDIAKMARLNTQASDYQEIIDSLYSKRRALDDEMDEKISTLSRLYYRYKGKSDKDIRKSLDKVKIVKMEKHAGGKVTKYYPLNAASMKKIKEKPRNVSLTFDAPEVSQKAINGLEVYKTVTYLCKSSSRFFLKPDIGEIFDAIDFHDLLGDEFDAICFHGGYETLPNTDGEHHIMTATLLVNTKERRKKEVKETVNALNKL